MGKRRRVEYSLNTGEIESLSEQEKKAILRGTDELINTGGRSMLTKILKGSKDKKLLELGLDQCPVYGFYGALTQEEISHRIDWMIKEDYIRIEYNGRLPMLFFSEKGWEMEREAFAEELYQRMCLDVQENQLRVIYEMKDVNRQVTFEVLEKIRTSRNEDFLPLLEAWKKLEVRKVRERIGSVEGTLRSGETGPVIVWRKAEKGDVNRVVKLIEQTVIQIYPRYYPQDVVDFFCFFHNEYRIKADIERKNVWVLLCDGKLVGTGSMEDNHVARVYVLPNEQGRGFGSRIMDELECRIRKSWDRVEVDASAPAKKFYEKRGYRTVRQETLSIGTMSMEYQVMEKQLHEE